MAEESKPFCLVYRDGKGCRQYPFSDREELAKWCARKPYANETGKMLLVLADGRMGPKYLGPIRLFPRALEAVFGATPEAGFVSSESYR